MSFDTIPKINVLIGTVYLKKVSYLTFSTMSLLFLVQERVQ